MTPKIQNPRPRPAHRGGFTLIELMIVVVVTGILVAAVYQIFYAGRRSHEVGRNLIDMQQNARVAISSLTSDFRVVSYGKDPTQPSVYYAGSDSLVYVADIVPDVPGAEKITYTLSHSGDPDTPNPNDTILWKTVADSGGTVLYRQPMSYGIQRNGLAFHYYNGMGTELPTPVAHPENIGEMAVQVTTTTAEKWQNDAYPNMTLTSTVYPRNLPLTPGRSRPSTPNTHNPTFPNCNSVTMAWDTPTTNTDGTALQLADISNFNFYYGPDPDHLDLNARLARTLNVWTVTNLACGNVYIAVSCVSRSGVESHLAVREVNVQGVKTPKAPTTLSAHDSIGVRLSWPAVTQYTDNTAIAVQVSYQIFRDVTSGFTPGEGNCIHTCTGGVTSWADQAIPGCGTYYYVVQAQVCCVNSASSPQVAVDMPSPPMCPASLAGTTGEQIGEMDLTWTNPTQRQDLSALAPGDISATRVYYDTLPGTVNHHVDLPGNGTSGMLTGLTGCKTYYIHAQTVDQCGHPSGATCLGNQATVALAMPCDPAPPVAPASLTLTPQDQRIDMQWPTDTADCDLLGYRIYYGTSTGVYNGTDAQQGHSPIQVTREAVTQGPVCLLSLTGLQACQNYYMAVTTIDRCSPPHESPKSPEAHAMPTCVPCKITNCCASWVDPTASSNKELHLEVYTQAGTNETLAKLVPTYAGTAKVLEVWYGRPLAKIWKSDGTAGQDGNVGPQPSGSTLNVTDVTVASTTTYNDGTPMALVFDSDVRDVAFDLKFKNPLNGFCTADATNRSAAVFDDFDDGNINGWTVRSGTWTSNNGELYESSASNNRLLIGSDTIGDLTFEGKMKIVSGTSAYFVFRYQDDNNMYTIGIRTDTGIVRLGRITAGTYTQTGSYSAALTNGNWYNLKVVLQGKRARVYLGCNQVIDATDNLMVATGKIGFRTASSTARWDDIRCQPVAQLP